MSTQGLLFGVCMGHQRGSAAVCDPNPPRPFARYRPSAYPVLLRHVELSRLAWHHPKWPCLPHLQLIYGESRKSGVAPGNQRRKSSIFNSEEVKKAVAVSEEKIQQRSWRRGQFSSSRFPRRKSPNLAGIAFRAAGKSGNNFPAASKFAGKAFQQGFRTATAFSSCLSNQREPKGCRLNLPIFGIPSSRIPASGIPVFRIPNRDCLFSWESRLEGFQEGGFRNSWLAAFSLRRNLLLLGSSY